MYRLVLYYLIILAAIGFIYSVSGVLPFNAIDYAFSFTFILIASYITNKVFSYVYEAPTNVESVWISALILGLIIIPQKTIGGVIFLGFASVLAMAGKYFFAIGKKHIFNPVAIAVFLTAVFINGTANWWVGNSAMLPFVAIGGFLIIRKLKRWDLVLSFLGVTIATTILAGFLKGSDITGLIKRSVVDTSLIFFASIMLTEPLTTPPTKNLRIIYGAIIGFLFAPQIHFGSFFLTPEIALIIGNIYAYIVSPKERLILRLKQKLRLSHDVYDFIFTPDKPIKFKPGQYMEWTFAHPKPDDRGNRRYLTIASSPTERDIHLGIKFANPPSTYKRNLFEMDSDKKIVASHLRGDFVMPTDPNKKLVFIAGGIGITPFRSMIKYLIDTNQRRDITLFYVAKNPDDFVYKEVLEEGRAKLGIKSIYLASSISGHIDAPEIAREVPDWGGRLFYLSGSHNMVESFNEILKKLGIPRSQIVTDYFPGFA